MMVGGGHMARRSHDGGRRSGGHVMARSGHMSYDGEERSHDGGRRSCDR